LFLRGAFVIHFDQGSVHEKTDSGRKKAMPGTQDYKKKDRDKIGRE
jgi:hypothetical protein